MWAHKALSELAPLVPEFETQDTADLETRIGALVQHALVEQDANTYHGISTPAEFKSVIVKKILDEIRKTPEPVNVDTPVLQTPSAVEMRAWISNHFGHVRGLCNLPENSDLAFTRWLLNGGHITKSQFMQAYPDFQPDE